LVGPRTAVTPFARSARANRLKIIVIGASLEHFQANWPPVHAENAARDIFGRCRSLEAGRALEHHAQSGLSIRGKTSRTRQS
jgi:hypothetical protein